MFDSRSTQGILQKMKGAKVHPADKLVTPRSSFSQTSEEAAISDLRSDSSARAAHRARA
jgi:hypothetical protein